MKKTVHIIGGGIIGLASAWYLMDDGYDVVIVDRTDLKDGTSHGNAGMIVPSHFIPMAAPGVVSQGMRWMFDPKSPFYVKPRLDLDLARWLWKFSRSCTKEHVEKCAPELYKFNEWSKQLYRIFGQDERFSFCFEEKGLLMLYKTEHQEREEIAMAERAQALGIDAQILSKSEVSNLEPALELDIAGGVYYSEDAHIYPDRFIHQLQKNLRARGAQIIANTEVIDFKYKSRDVSHLITSDGRSMSVDQLVISGGSWTSYLLQKLGIKILLQDGKGYSFTIKSPSIRPTIPTILTERKVALTPMGQDLRIGGTLELGGLSAKVHKQRIAGIIDSLPRYYPRLSIEAQDLKKIWIGYRPCTPDGLPYIGRPNGITNLTITTGHGMMGMSMGPATGKLVSEIITKQSTTIDTSLYRVNR